MSRMLSETTRSLALGAVVGAVVTLLMPWLVATTTDAPSLVVLTAMLLAALTGFSSRAAMRAVRAHAPLGTPTKAQSGALLPGRVTDAPHHPLRPRAPGVV